MTRFFRYRLLFFSPSLCLSLLGRVSSKQKHKLETQSENVFEAKDEKRKRRRRKRRKVKGLERVTASLSLIAYAGHFMGQEPSEASVPSCSLMLT